MNRYQTHRNSSHKSRQYRTDTSIEAKKVRNKNSQRISKNVPKFSSGHNQKEEDYLPQIEAHSQLSSRYSNSKLSKRPVNACKNMSMTSASSKFSNRKFRSNASSDSNNSENNSKKHSKPTFHHPSQKHIKSFCPIDEFETDDERHFSPSHRLSTELSCSNTEISEPSLVVRTRD